MAMASLTLRLMVLFSSDSTFTMCGLMLWPVVWQCSKTAEVSGAWCSLIRVLDKGKGADSFANIIVQASPLSAESRKPLLLNKGNTTTNSLQAYAQKEQKRFCLKISSAFDKLYFLLNIPGFPHFLHFETQKYLHVLFINSKNGKWK